MAELEDVESIEKALEDQPLLAEEKLKSNENSTNFNGNWLNTPQSECMDFFIG